MNLSAPNISPSSSRYAKPNDGKPGTGTQPSGPSDGGFADLFADVAQRSAAPEISGKLVGSKSRAGTSKKAEVSPANKKPRLDPEPKSPVKKKAEEGIPVPEELLVRLDDPLEITLPGDLAAEAGDAIAAVWPDELGNASSAAAEGPAASPVISLLSGDVKTVGEIAPQAFSKTALAVDDVANDEKRSGGLADGETAVPIQLAASNSARFSGASAQNATRGQLTPPTEIRSTAEFAEAEKPGASSEKAARNVSIKNFLTSDQQSPAKESELFGINVANSQSEMANASLHPSLDNVLSKNTVPAHEFQPASSEWSAQNLTPAETPFLGEAHKAVEAAIEVSERFTTASQRAVNLQFSIRGENLSVHVEMAGGAVRTTFRTDSADLRVALAHEWQALAASSTDRVQRFSDPVFTAGGSPLSQSGGGESQGNGRGHETRQSPQGFEFSSRPAAAGGPGTSALAAASPHPVAPLTALRLRLFA